MKTLRENKGFTLIELLLVVVIIGLMLAVIVPRAWRANIDTKYGLTRQNCSELASFGQEWMEQQLLAQEEQTSTATADNYLVTLTGNQNYTSPRGAWIAFQTTSNWNTTGAPIRVTGRTIGADTNMVPEACVEDIIPPEKIPRNPFNEVSVFVESNDPSTASMNNVVVGAIYCGVVTDGAGVDTWHYYAFLFQGTDSTSITNNNDSFHAGQSIADLKGLRNGIFFARIRPGI